LQSETGKKRKKLKPLKKNPVTMAVGLEVSVVMSFLVSVSGWVGGVESLDRIIMVRLAPIAK
jgi:type IV secretory pathway VirJ component